MEQQSTLKQRLKQFLISQGITEAEFGKRIQVSNAYVSSIRKGIPADKLLLITQNFPSLNLDWLQFGRGKMLHSIFPSSARRIVDFDFMLVPIVHVKARCGYLTGYGDEEFIDHLPTMPVTVDRKYHGRYLVFEAEGDSMDDGTRNAICDGDKLLCREVRRDLWTPRLHINDWYFVIVDATEGVVIKQITHQDDEGNLTCHSLNPLFQDYTVNLSTVKEIYSVVRLVERPMRI